MEEKQRETEIRLVDLWTIFKHCWWIMLIVLVAVSILAYAVMATTHRDEYTTTVTIWAMRTPDSMGNGSSTSTLDVSMATYLINDYKEMIGYPIIMEKVIAAQNLSVSVGQLSKMATVTHETDTRLINLSVTTASPAASKAIADSWGQIFCEHVNGIMNAEVVAVFDPAQLPTQPSNPVSLFKVLLIALVCAILVYVVYFVRFLLDDKINSTEDVEHYLGLSTLGVIPNKNFAGRKSKSGHYYTRFGGEERRSI